MDKGYIYKIQNKINGKVYIGKTINYRARWRDHIARERDTAIHRAISKYGPDNFDFSVIEFTNNLSEREEYWISYYDSYHTGYNCSLGMDGGSPTQLLKIIDDYEEIKEKILRDYDKSLDEIADEHGVSARMMRQFNQGDYSRYVKDYDRYPLRDAKKYSYVIIQDVQKMLASGASNADIIKKYGMSQGYVSAINQGHEQFNPALSYPLRKGGRGSVLTAFTINTIEKDIEQNIDFNEIAEKHGISRKTVLLINRGQHKYSSTTRVFPIVKLK